MSRVSLTPDKLDPELNSLLLQSYNLDGVPIDVGVMTSETVFKRWAGGRSRRRDADGWTTDDCQVLYLYHSILVMWVTARYRK